MRLLREQYHLANIFDFRMESERDTAPDVEVPGAVNHWLPPFDSSLYDADTRDSLEAMFKGGAEAMPLLIQAAKAGMIRQMYSAILTSDIARAAYAEQGVKMQALAEENGLDEAATKDLLAIALVQLDYFHLAIDSVKEEYGSVNGYLHDGLGLTDEDIQTLRDKFLEG